MPLSPTRFALKYPTKLFGVRQTVNNASLLFCSLKPAREPAIFRTRLLWFVENMSASRDRIHGELFKLYKHDRGSGIHGKGWLQASLGGKHRAFVENCWVLISRSRRALYRGGCASAAYSTNRKHLVMRQTYGWQWKKSRDVVSRQSFWHLGDYGTPGVIRTPDPLLRRQVLYPAELRAHS